EAEAVAAPAQRSDRGREAQEEHPDRARQARRSAQTDPGDDVLDRRPGGVRDVRADGRADRARGAQAHRRGRGARGPLRRLAREAVPGAGGPRRHGPAAARAETEAGTAPRGLARRSQAAREGREGSRARPGRRRRAVPLSTETSPARSPGATFVALFIAALVIWFVLRVAEVLILVFLAVLAAVYFSAITDQLERRFLMPRWVGLLCAVVGTVAVIAGAGVLIVPPVIDQTQALLSGLPQTLTDIQNVIARWASDYPGLGRRAAARDGRARGVHRDRAVGAARAVLARVRHLHRTRRDRAVLRDPRVHPAARAVHPRDRQLAAGAGGRGLGRGGALL